MFKNLTYEQKEERFNSLIDYAEKIRNKSLKNAILCLLEQNCKSVIFLILYSKNSISFLEPI